MSTAIQNARGRINESEPINVVARLATNGRLWTPNDLTSWDAKIFDLRSPSAREPIYEALGQSGAGVISTDLIDDGLLRGGRNFLATFTEAVFPGGHRGSTVYRIELVLNSTLVLSSTKVLLLDVQIEPILSS